MMTNSEILLYQTEDGQTKIDVRLEEETVWLSQKQMVELFQTTKQNISLHIRNIFKEGELDEISVVKDYLTTASDGKQYSTNYYNLDVVISAGYRVKSPGYAIPYLQARNRNPMYMSDWIKKFNDFMTLNDKEILEHAGRISAKMAKELAESEYEKYRKKMIAIEDAQEIKALEAGLKRLENKKKKSKMNPLHTVPSLSGTCRKRCKPAHKPNLRQEPSSPSHAIVLTVKHCSKIETFKSRKENSQHITIYKIIAGMAVNSGVVACFNLFVN